MDNRRIVLPSGQAAVVHRTHSNRAPYFVGFKETNQENGNMPSICDLRKIAVLIDESYEKEQRQPKSLWIVSDQVKPDSPWLTLHLGCWSRMWLATPEKGEHFQKGKDIKDTITGHILPASELKNATGGEIDKPGIGIYIDPADFYDKDGHRCLDPSVDVNKTFDSGEGVVVISKSTFVVENLRESGKLGKVEYRTGLIVEGVNDYAAVLRHDYIRAIYPDLAGESNRPLAFGDYGPYIGGVWENVINGHVQPSVSLAVFRLEAQQMAEQVKEHQ